MKPSATFLRLAEAKQQSFIRAFLREFTLHKFDDASLSRVLKQLKIAKGSFYQYFEDKTSLYFYLVERCGAQKGIYLIPIKRADYTDFWDYWKALYDVGFEMDAEHPEMSNFMLKMTHSLESPTLLPFFRSQRKQTLSYMADMLSKELDNQTIRKDISIESMANHLLVSSEGLLDYLQLHYREEFEQRIIDGSPLFAGEIKIHYEQLIQENIKLLKQAFKPN